MRPRLFYCDHYEPTLPEGHRFPMAKYRLLRERLTATGRFELEPAPLATPETIGLAHEAGYVRGFLAGELSREAMRRIGFPWSPGLVQRTCASVGGTLAAAREALANGWSGTLAGGTHHAFFAEGSGYCIFHDMVVAIRALRAEGRVGRVLVIDLDVHQGDGTAVLLGDDPLSYTLSAHGRLNFPFRKQRSTVDLEFEDGTGDDEYLARVAEALPAAMAFGPEIVFFQAGVDALGTDALGRLGLTLEGLRRRDALVFGATADVPLAITLGGGYSVPIERTVEAHAQTFLGAASARVCGS